MPSVSERQHIAMVIAAKHPEKSKHNIPQDVAREFVAADKRSGKFRGRKKRKLKTKRKK